MLNRKAQELAISYEEALLISMENPKLLRMLRKGLVMDLDAEGQVKASHILDLYELFAPIEFSFRTSRLKTLGVPNRPLVSATAPSLSLPPVIAEDAPEATAVISKLKSSAITQKEVFGRSIKYQFGDDESDILVFKLRRESEDLTDLQREYAMQSLLASSVRSEIPKPIAVMRLPISSLSLDLDQQEALFKQEIYRSSSASADTSSNEYVDVFVYQPSKDYLTYVTDLPDLGSLESSLTKSAFDLGKLVHSGLIFPQLISLLHTASTRINFDKFEKSDLQLMKDLISEDSTVNSSTWWTAIAPSLNRYLESQGSEPKIAWHNFNPSELVSTLKTKLDKDTFERIKKAIHAGRDDKGRYQALTFIMKPRYSRILPHDEGEHAPVGKISRVHAATNFANLRASGIADLGDCLEVEKIFSRSPFVESYFKDIFDLHTNQYIRAHNAILMELISEYFLSFSLLIARWGANQIEHDPSLNQTKFWEELSSITARVYGQLLSALLGTEVGTEVQWVTELMKLDQHAAQNRFWWIENYGDTVRKGGEFKEPYYSKHDQIRIHPDKLQAGERKAFEEDGREFFSPLDGKDRHLGPENGPNPLKEDERIRCECIRKITLNWMVYPEKQAQREAEAREQILIPDLTDRLRQMIDGAINNTKIPKEVKKALEHFRKHGLNQPQTPEKLKNSIYQFERLLSKSPGLWRVFGESDVFKIYKGQLSSMREEINTVLGISLMDQEKVTHTKPKEGMPFLTFAQYTAQMKNPGITPTPE